MFVAGLWIQTIGLLDIMLAYFFPFFTLSFDHIFLFLMKSLHTFVEKEEGKKHMYGKSDFDHYK